MNSEETSRTEVSRAAHLASCKVEALKYCAAGDVVSAWRALRDGLLEHPETRDHQAIFLGTLMLSLGQLSKPDAMRAFIQGVE